MAYDSGLRCSIIVFCQIHRMGGRAHDCAFSAAFFVFFVHIWVSTFEHYFSASSLLPLSVLWRTRHKIMKCTLHARTKTASLLSSNERRSIAPQPHTWSAPPQHRPESSTTSPTLVQLGKENKAGLRAVRRARPLMTYPTRRLDMRSVTWRRTAGALSPLVHTAMGLSAHARSRGKA